MDDDQDFTSGAGLKVAVMWRGAREERGRPMDANNRLQGVVRSLTALGVAASPCVFAEDAAEEVREQLLASDGVLVWVDPIADEQDRSLLDPLLRDVAKSGVWVSAHPDVIMKMGVKEVLYRTRGIGWAVGADTDIYLTFPDFVSRFPSRLESGPRVLKQNRGNGGIGVWRVERMEDGAPATAAETVRVLHARRGSAEEYVSLGDFMDRCAGYLRGDGRIIDQAFQQRLAEGMIRCYLSQNKVVGFGHQLIKALVAPPPGATPEDLLPGPRIMHDARAPAFQTLRGYMETDWVPAMQELLDIDTLSLPVIWDADFLYGARNPVGEDTYILCEINVSAVSPYPDQAPAHIARAAVHCIQMAKRRRDAS